MNIIASDDQFLNLPAITGTCLSIASDFAVPRPKVFVGASYHPGLSRLLSYFSTLDHASFLRSDIRQMELLNKLSFVNTFLGKACS